MKILLYLSEIYFSSRNFEIVTSKSFYDIMKKVSEKGTSIMSVAMSSKDGPELGDTSAADIMTQGVTITPDDEIEAVYELERCRAWIQHESLTKVALQFPDHLLPDSALVIARLQARVGLPGLGLGPATWARVWVPR